MTVTGLVVAGFILVGLAVVTSKPFQEAVLHTEVLQDTASEASSGSLESADEASKLADAQQTGAMDETVSKAEPVVMAEAADDAASEPADEPPSEAADAAAAPEGECCKVGDETPPLELVKQVPPGGLHNPYDWQKLKAESPEDYLVKQFRLPGCNECHGGGGGGGFCPALSQGVWFWGNTDDVLFRLISMGSADLEKSGFTRIQWGTVKAGMPQMGHVIKTSDHLWKIISFIRSINPPGTNPPEKVIPGRYTPPADAAPAE
jgi:hypothetical protein